MRDRTIFCGADALREFPDRAGAKVGFPGFPELTTRRQFGIRKADFELSCDRVEMDDVTIPEQRNRTTDSSLGTHVADAETPGRARESDRKSVV